MQERLLEILRQTATAGVQPIQFSGSEPMLREKLVLRLMHDTRRLGMQPMLSSKSFCPPVASTAALKPWRRAAAEPRLSGPERLPAQL